MYTFFDSIVYINMSSWCMVYGVWCMVASGVLDLNYPLYIIEIGSGNGRFAMFFVAHLNVIINQCIHAGATALVGTLVYMSS